MLTETALVAESKQLFAKSLDEYCSQNKKVLLKSQVEISKIIGILKRAETGEKFSREEKNNYRLVESASSIFLYDDFRYRYEETDGGEIILQNIKGKLVPSKETLFDILFKVHTKKGHGGCSVMYSSTRLQKYEAITKSCELKKSIFFLVVKPILSKEFNSRCQLDLIDLQSKRDGIYGHVFVYQDHLIKYVLLRPLPQKSAVAVEKVLRQVFCDFGPPDILQTDNGKEFANSRIERLTKEFNCKLIHGKARHSQSQGSVERANRDIQDILAILMQRRACSEWSTLLPEVQIMKNTRHHRGIARTPYMALFGRESVYGLGDNNPGEEGEEDGEEDGGEDGGEDYDLYDIGDLGGLEDDAEESGEEGGEDGEEDGEEDGGENGREDGEEDRGEHGGEHGIDVDRGKTDHRNVPGVVVRIKNDLYSIGTKSGLLNGFYSRSQLEVVEAQFMTVEDAPQGIM
uniref:Integrase catalytic domain-containing protein n=1 Tax=Panagrolaimus sp. ES5 TaxID=591445 RepID=A0AC34FXC6_9BILA